MNRLAYLFKNNRNWAEKLRRIDPDFFHHLADQQTPEFLWIGCSDSRVPANDIVGLMPGELFVHRNVANLVVHSDINGQSVIQFAVEVLKVKHIIVCGHYGCGGVRAAMQSNELGLIDSWLRHIRDVHWQYRDELAALPNDQRRLNRLCELNVREQVLHVCQTTFVQNAWQHGEDLSVHGWIYDIRDGHLRDLGLCITSPEQLDEIYRVRQESVQPDQPLFRRLRPIGLGQ